MTDPGPKAQRSESVAARSERRAFIFVAALGAMLIPAALGIALGMSVDMWPLLKFDIADVAFGVAAVMPLALLLRWFMKTGWRPLAEFRASQLEFLSTIGFRLTGPRIVTLAIIAGVSEELMFRGVLQEIIDRRFGIAAAIAVTSVIFGLLHARTVLYAFVATMVGAYLSLLFLATGSLIAPIVAHAVYDFIAFEWTRIALDRRAAISPAVQDQPPPQ